MRAMDLQKDSKIGSVAFTYAADPWTDRTFEFRWNLSLTVNVYSVDHYFHTTESKEVDVFTWSVNPTIEEVVKRCNEWMQENVYCHYVDSAF